MRGVSLLDLGSAAILAFFAVQGSIPFIAPNQALESNNAAASGLMIVGGIVSQLLVYGAIAFLILRHARQMIRRAVGMQWAAFLGLLAVASSSWSQFPLYTLRRSLPFALAGLFGLYLAVRFPLRRQLFIFWLAMLVLAGGTIIMALGFPHLGLDASAGHQTDWQGVFTQKNACGRMMVLATAVVLSSRHISAPRAISLVVFLGIIFMSGSRGAWIVESAVLGLYAGLRLVGRLEDRSRAVAIAAGAAICLSVVVGAIYYYPLIAGLMGRDATLSGRTQIWRQVWPFILRRPLLGWGYSGFWRGIQGEAFQVMAAVRFLVFHAHNGFLEIWLELGLAGLALYALSYLRAWRRLWPVLVSGNIERVAWMVFVLALTAIYGLDENTLLIYNGLFWVIYVATLANIEFLALEDRTLHEVRVLSECERPAHISTVPEMCAQ
jgi:exopolysaccharide production protein ExoQ